MYHSVIDILSLAMFPLLLWLFETPPVFEMVSTSIAPLRFATIADLIFVHITFLVFIDIQKIIICQSDNQKSGLTLSAGEVVRNTFVSNK